jgi:tetratricopeptide (TPR) repeat protein
MAMAAPMGRNNRIWAVVGTLLCGAVASFPQNTGKTVRHHREVVEDDATTKALASAEVAIEKRDLAAAEPLLKQVVEKDPANYQAWFDLGFVYNAQHKIADSIDAYQKSVAAKPDVFESNLNLGLMLAKQGRPDAEKYLRAATKLNPTDHPEEGKERAWLSLAQVLEKTDSAGALEAYRQAASFAPKDPEPHIAAGLLLERENQFADAEKEYRQVLTLDPQSVEATTALANIYMRAQRFSEAEAMLRTLSAQRPDDAGLHVQLGRVLAAQGKNTDAIAELEAGVKLTPNDVAAQRDLADLYKSAGKYEQSENSYRALLTAKPNDADLHQSLGQVLMKEKKWANAQQEFWIATQLKPESSGILADLAAAAQANHNYPLSIQALDKAAKLLPEPPAIYYFLRATAYDNLRDNKQAALNYHSFLQMANGKFPEQEWQARHRLIAIEPKK